MISKILLFACLLPLLVPQARGQTAGTKHILTEAMAVEKVMQLPEVERANAYIRQHSIDKRKLFAMIYGVPTRQQPYYWVAVGEDNGMSFVTHFGFHVYIRTGKIWYIDTLNGTEIDLRTWRKSRRKH
ncbi:MAG TPA: hypothetical protein VL727_19785 [Puia sp.]|jgi:hypothetical protein|nr:hypothetical protein [Puia sp.]